MNPDGTSDVNLRAWVGPGADGRDDSGILLDERGEDMPAQPYAGPAYTSPLKFTRAFQSRGQLIRFGVVHAGSENAIDVNDGSDVKVAADLWVLAGSKYGMTCKGASSLDVMGAVAGSGKECDVDFGNYSDQRPRGMSSGRLNLWRADGSPIRVRCIQANKPALEPGSGPYVFVAPDPAAWWHGLFIELFLLLRRNRLAFT